MDETVFKTKTRGKGHGRGISRGRVAIECKWRGWAIAACLAALLLMGGGVKATAEDTAPAPVCAIDHDALPQYEVTSDFAKGVLQHAKNGNMEVFGIAEDKYGDFMIWYNAQEDNHSCFMGKGTTGLWMIVYPEDCVTTYQQGLLRGDYEIN
jgi:hypothetical protein